MLKIAASFLVALSALLLTCVTCVTSKGSLLLQCPPAEEGKPFTAVCTVGLEPDESIVWSLHFPSAKPNTQHIFCFGSSNDCTYKGKYGSRAASLSQNETHSKSQLDIQSVSRIHHKDGRVKCTSKVSRNAKTCQVYVYALPKNAVCTAQSNNSKVTVRCTTTYVHPDLNCEIRQINYGSNSGETTIIRREMIKYKSQQKFKNGQTYSEANCSGEFFVSRPGTYKYNVTLYPKIPNTQADHFKSVEVRTNSVFIKDSAYIVEIEDPGTIVVCYNQTDKVVRLLCKVSGLQNRPEFLWTVDNVGHPEEALLKSNSDQAAFHSYLNLSIDRSPNKKLLTCTVEPKSDYQPLTKQLPLHVVQTPRVPPVFQTSEGQLVEEVFSFSSNTKQIPLQCVAAEKITTELRLAVSCFDVDQRYDNESLHQTTEYHFPFHAHGFYVKVPRIVEIHCTCTIKPAEANTCDDPLLKTKLRLIPHIRPASRSHQDRSEDANILTPFLVAVSIVVAIIVVTIIVYVKLSKRRHSQLDTQTHIIDASTPLHSPEEVMPYASANVADRSWISSPASYLEPEDRQRCLLGDPTILQLPDADVSERSHSGSADPPSNDFSLHSSQLPEDLAGSRSSSIGSYPESCPMVTMKTQRTLSEEERIYEEFDFADASDTNCIKE